jgi:exodeoxyribonuclease-3
MSTIKLACWNVNGVRSISKKGFFDWLEAEKPDIVGLQETKIDGSQLTAELSAPRGYVSYWSHAERKGYSGVVIYAREKPLSVKEGLGIGRFDVEGRVLTADFGDFTLMNIYYPNGKASPERLQYKMDFYESFLKQVNKLKKAGKRLIICGDFNTAHKEIDLARPKDNQAVSGFLPQERDWMDRFVDSGYIDTFRAFNGQAHNYTWWHLVTRARERNVGWRIDYFFASDNLKEQLIDAGIQTQVQGSDHCPVTLRLRL